MQIDLTNQVALVTGSAHRVGRAIAVALAKAGVNIVVHYNSADTSTVRDTMHEIKSHGVDAISIQANLSNQQGVGDVFSAIDEHFGKLDILVNSASVFHKNRLLEVSLADWQTSLDVNLTAPFLCTQAAVPLLKRNIPTGGVIINICDYGALHPWAERVDHNISKAGLWMLTQVSALSLGGDNIRVNAILPGPVMKSPDMTDEFWRKIGANLPLGRTGDENDVARAVVYLAGESFITGTMLTVNGGETL
jgi:NAD(P)-dependent dehydrogenase (short-subunit alcohol dehydrogenase family)